MSDRLRKLIDESRDELGAREVRDIDWDAVDRELFARLEQERRLERFRAVGPRAPAWGVGAAVLAAAAVLALVAGKTHSMRTPTLESPVAVAVAPAAGNVVGILGGGELLVGGKPVTTGTTLHLGDVLETRGTSVTVERPGKLSMILEAGTHATVTHVQGALILALDTGAIEAQVVPVPSGEAFAVDVAGTRVAVHGTHLRVARDGVDGQHVAVDLNEGVVVVGPAPREGSTVGTLVTAPAHADFATPDLAGTLKITHDPAAVRPPNGITVSAQSASGNGGVYTATMPAAPAANPRPEGARPATAPVVRPAPAVPAAPTPAVPVPDPNAPATLAAAVRGCVMTHPSPENVTVVLNTTLHVDLDADGNVKAARFDPPVAPDVNVCAAPVIYRTRFAHDGSADVPVDVKVPASAP